MKKLALAGLLLCCCCHEQPAPQNTVTATTKTDTSHLIAPESEDPAWDTTISDYDIPFTDTLIADFNGDGHIDTAFTVRTRRQRGNPVETGTEGAFETHFSDSSIAPLPYGCCEAKLIQEGDLNNDGADDLSVFMKPVNGNAYFFSTYTFKNKKWKYMMEPTIIPVTDDMPADSILRQKVFVENDTLYFLKLDLNDGSLIKTKANPYDLPVGDSDNYDK